MLQFQRKCVIFINSSCNDKFYYGKAERIHQLIIWTETEYQRKDLELLNKHDLKTKALVQ